MFLMKNDVFWDRHEELKRIRRFTATRGFGFITGRRRIGKTALLKRACEEAGGFYHQAVEGTAEQQLLHLTEEIRDGLPLFRDVSPKTWAEFFRLLSKEKLPKLLIFDEFPYWAQGDPSLPSVLQKWVDHDLPKSRSALLVSGSSQSMLNSHFLNREAPLYGRASLHLRLSPLSYKWFCRALGFKAADPSSFTRFSLVGGVPHYWKLMPKGNLIDQMEALFFQPSAILSEEPGHWLRDEGITGTLPKAILDLIGRGVTKPSELAGRLGVPQGHLPRPLAVLLELGFIRREFPFGESARSSKRVHYSVQDPALSFFYGTYLPHRHRWEGLKARDKEIFLTQHTSRQWENYCRSQYPGANRYWEGNIEIDLVARMTEKEEYLVAECKWKKLDEREETSLLADLKVKFQNTRLAKKIRSVKFKILSQPNLASLKRPA